MVPLFAIGDLVAVRDQIGVVDDMRTLGPNNEVLPRVNIKSSIPGLFQDQFKVRDMRMQPLVSGKGTRYPENRWLDPDELCLLKHGPLHHVLASDGLQQIERI